MVFGTNIFLSRVLIKQQLPFQNSDDAFKDSYRRRCTSLMDWFDSLEVRPWGTNFVERLDGSSYINSLEAYGCIK